MGFVFTVVLHIQCFAILRFVTTKTLPFLHLKKRNFLLFTENDFLTKKKSISQRDFIAYQPSTYDFKTKLKIMPKSLVTQTHQSQKINII